MPDRCQFIVRSICQVNKARRNFLKRAAFIATVCGGVLFSGVAAAQGEPEALIRKITQEVLDEVKADRSLLTGDIIRLNNLVDRRVMPHVNFERMTALSVGRSWRSATPAQQEVLMKEFRLLLLLTYADAVRQFTDLTIRVLPVRSRPEDSQVVVRTQVLRAGQEPVQLDYRLEKSNDRWKIFDLNILGLWLIENYRTQFNQIVTAKGIQGLIQELQDKNQSLSAAVTAKRSTR
jgi:phospholipid transport system substrate-binding protein